MYELADARRKQLLSGKRKRNDDNCMSNREAEDYLLLIGEAPTNDSPEAVLPRWKWIAEEVVVADEDKNAADVLVEVRQQRAGETTKVYRDLLLLKITHELSNDIAVFDGDVLDQQIRPMATSWTARAPRVRESSAMRPAGAAAALRLATPLPPPPTVVGRYRPARHAWVGTAAAG